MATTKNTVAKSYDVRDAALNLAAKAYDVRRTVAAVWNVKPTAPQSPSPEATFSLDMTNSSEESVVDGGDERVLVDKSSFAPGGKYRCKSMTTRNDNIRLIQSCSDCQTFHSLRVSKARKLGHGYRLAHCS